MMEILATIKRIKNHLKHGLGYPLELVDAW